MEQFPKRELKDTFLRGLPSAEKGQRYVVADTLVPGLKVRVSDTGSKTFIVWHRWNGAKNPSARTIGRFGNVGLADARKTAREWLEMRTRGIDPKAHKPTGNIFGDLIEEYLARQVSKQRRGVRTSREIRTQLLPRWKDRSVHDITRADVMALLDEMKARGVQRQAHNVYGHLRSFYNWLIDRGIYGITSSPCDRLRPSRVIGPKRHRDRTLTVDEIRALWRAADAMGYPWGSLYKLALLTGARRSELGGMRWSEIDMASGVWTVPPERFKRERTNVVPLCNDALAILRTIPRWIGSDVVFSSSSGQSPVKTYSKAAARLKALMATELGHEPDFVLHDVRRTTRTGLARVGVSFEVAELIIGHTPQGIGKVYNQHSYRDEMREGVERWAAQLRETVEPGAAAAAAAAG